MGKKVNNYIDLYGCNYHDYNNIKVCLYAIVFPVTFLGILLSVITDYTMGICAYLLLDFSYIVFLCALRFKIMKNTFAIRFLTSGITMFLLGKAFLFLGIIALIISNSMTVLFMIGTFFELIIHIIFVCLGAKRLFQPTVYTDIKKVAKITLFISLLIPLVEIFVYITLAFLFSGFNFEGQMGAYIAYFLFMFVTNVLFYCAFYSLMLYFYCKKNNIAYEGDSSEGLFPQQKKKKSIVRKTLKCFLYLLVLYLIIIFYIGVYEVSHGL